MTNRELIEWLEEFGDHLKVVVLQERETEDVYYAVEEVDTPRFHETLTLRLGERVFPS